MKFKKKKIEFFLKKIKIFKKNVIFIKKSKKYKVYDKYFLKNNIVNSEF